MVEKQVWKILLVDDDEDDYLLTREMLAMAQGTEIQLKWAPSFIHGHQSLESDHYDAVLIDYDLGEHTGLELIREADSKNYSAPLILITGRGGYEVDLEAMQAGATLFLTKSEINPLLLQRSIRYAVERKQADLALKTAHANLETRVEARTRELAQANKDLQATKLTLENRVAERTSDLQQANAKLEIQLAEGERILAELKQEKLTSELERDMLLEKEGQIARLTRLYVVLSQVNEAIVRIHNKQALFTEVCTVVAESGFPLVWVGEVKGKEVVPVAAAGLKTGYLNEIKIEIDGELGKGPTGACIRENHTVINENFSSNPATLPWRASAIKYDFNASTSIPLHSQAKVIGSLTLYACEPNAFEPEQVKLLEALCADISYALDAMDQEKQRHQAEQDLIKSEKAYRSLFEGMTEGFALHEIVCDSQGKPTDYRFLEINPAFERLTGLKRENVVGKLHNDVLPGDDPLWVKLYGAVALKGKPIHFDNYSPALKQHYEVFAYRPAPRQFAVLFMNITEQKLKDETLRESEKRYRSLFENMQEGFYVGRAIYGEDGIANDFEYIDANRAFEKIMGLSGNQIIGHRAKELVPLIQPAWAELFGKVQQTGEPTYYTSYSEVFGQYFEAYAFRPTKGQFAVLVSDITERKRAEEKLAQQNQLIELSYEPIFSWDLEKGILSWNKGCEQVYGYTRAEVMGKISHDLLKTIHPVPLEQLLTNLQNTGSWSGELRQITKNGREVILESRQQLIETNGKRLVLETNRDITERKQTDQALRANQERISWLARFPDENPNPVLRASFSGKILYCNEPARKLLGSECITGQSLTWALMPILEGAILNEKARNVETTVKIGEEFFTFAGIPIKGKDYVNLYGRNVTAKKAVEDALQQSEARYRLLFTSVQEGFTLNQAIFGADGSLDDLRVLDANPSAEKANGLKRDEFVGKTWKQLWPGAEADWWETCNQVILEGKEFRFENYAAVPGRWYEVHHFKVGKDLLGSIFMDISERKAAEKKEAAEHQWFRTTLDSIGDAVITTDNRGAVTFLNPVAEKLSAWSNLEAAGKPMEHVFPLVNELTHQPAVNPAEKVLESGDIVDLANHTVLVRKDGQTIPIEDSAAPIKGQQGETVGVVMVFHDVTEKRAKEAALREAETQMKDYAQKLERSNRELQDFASIASHDLQEPLRKIKSFGGLLESRLAGQLKEQDKDYFQRMQSAAGRMQQLIDSLLSLSRVSTKNQPFRPVDLQSLATELLASFEPHVGRIGAQVDISGLPEIEADETQMRQLFQNLISNSLKFHNQTVQPCVKISGEIISAPQEPGCRLVKMQIKDNGIGFDMKYADRIFQPFERLHGRNEFEGTGIGLAICKRIVERHQGSIAAQSEVDRGATFTVVLPVTHHEANQLDTDNAADQIRR